MQPQGHCGRNLSEPFPWVATEIRARRPPAPPPRNQRCRRSPLRNVAPHCRFGSGYGQGAMMRRRPTRAAFQEDDVRTPVQLNKTRTPYVESFRPAALSAGYRLRVRSASKGLARSGPVRQLPSRALPGPIRLLDGRAVRANYDCRIGRLEANFRVAREPSVVSGA